ncbi:MAG TPA: endolytic transglycosylase MltG, partial [bacterium]|nr:endolytic transglycosylase MltG [bacterium]
MGVDAPSLEGFLFPETYRLYWGINERKVISIMVRQFFNVVNGSLKRQMLASGMTLNDMVALASIIESEAQKDEERPIISQVYHRRLKLGMSLDADPTIQYALGERRKLLNVDKKIDSPYNTYTHRGLPPGSICNP